MARTGPEDQERIQQMRAGLRARLVEMTQRAAASAERHSSTALLSVLCASSIAPVVAAAATPAAITAAVAGAVGSIGANALSDVALRAVDRLRGRTGGTPASVNDVEQELAARIEAALAAGDDAARLLRQDIAGLFDALQAAEVALDAAVRSGDAETRQLMTSGFAALARDFDELHDLVAEMVSASAELQRAHRQHDAAQQQTLAMTRQTYTALTQVRADLTEALRHVAGASHDRPDTAAAEWRGRSPYRGLAPFAEEYAGVYFGREQATASLFTKLGERLVTPSLVVVTGASGVGKSSLLAAGAMPALSNGMLGVAGSEHWPRLVITPTARPLDELAAHLAHLTGTSISDVRSELAQHPDRTHLLVRQAVMALTHSFLPPKVALYGDLRGQERDGSNPRLVLVVDQLEQLFTLAGREDEEGDADTFLTALTTAATEPVGPGDEPAALVVLCVRGDHWDRCAAHPGLAPLLEAAQFVVEPMAESDLRRTVTGPADVAGLHIDHGLVDTILADLRSGTAPGTTPTAALALVSQAMLTTWEHREGDRLTARAYGRSGGVLHAVRVSAEAAYESLTPERRVVAQTVFVGLTAVTPDHDLARRHSTADALRASLPTSSADDVDAVVSTFAEQRLLVLDGDTIEIAHDLLFHAWPRLQDWLADDRERLLRYGRLVDRARTWEDEGQDPAYLYRGVELASAQDLVATADRKPSNLPAFDKKALEFVAVGAAVQRRQTRQDRLSRWVALAAAILVLVTALIGRVLLDETRDNERDQAEALSRDLARQSGDTVAGDPGLAMLQALAAYEASPTEDAEQALFHLYLDHQSPEAVLSGARGQIVDADASADGRVVAAVTDLGLVTLWLRQPGQAVRTRQLDRPAGGTGVFVTVKVTDDGDGVYVADGRLLWSYDVAADHQQWELPLPAEVIGLWANDDGTFVVEHDDEDLTTVLDVWDVTADGTRPARRFSRPTAEAGTTVGFGPEPDTLVMQQYPAGVDRRDGVLELWDLTTDQRRVVARDTVADGLTANGLAYGCSDALAADSVVVVDVRAGGERRFALPENAECSGAVADVRGEVVVTEARTGAVDLHTGDVMPQPASSSSVPEVAEAVVSDGSRHLVVARTETAVVLEVVQSDTSFLAGLSYVPDGHLEAEPLPDGEHVVALLDVGARLVVGRASANGTAFEVVASVDRPFPRYAAELGELAVNAAGTLVADRVDDDRVQVRRLPDLTLVSEMDAVLLDEPGIESPSWESVPTLGFVGDRLFTTDGPTAQWWDPATGDELARLDMMLPSSSDHNRGGMWIAAHPDPNLAAVTVEAAAEMHIVEVDSGEQVASVPIGRGAVGSVFQPDGTSFMVLRGRGRLEMWDSVAERQIVGAVEVPARQALFGRFLTEPGAFVVAWGGGSTETVAQVRWYAADDPSAVRAFDLGDAANELPRQVVSTTAQGDALLYRRDSALGPLDVVVGVAPIDVEVWREHLCRLLDGRRFTDDELAGLPSDVADLDVC